MDRYLFSGWSSWLRTSAVLIHELSINFSTVLGLRDGLRTCLDGSWKCVQQGLAQYLVFTDTCFKVIPNLYKMRNPPVRSSSLCQNLYWRTWVQLFPSYCLPPFCTVDVPHFVSVCQLMDLWIVPTLGLL